MVAPVIKIRHGHMTGHGWQEDQAKGKGSTGNFHNRDREYGFMIFEKHPSSLGFSNTLLHVQPLEGGEGRTWRKRAMHAILVLLPIYHGIRSLTEYLTKADEAMNLDVIAQGTLYLIRHISNTVHTWPTMELPSSRAPDLNNPHT